jgi:hypothetical protein
MEGRKKFYENVAVITASTPALESDDLYAFEQGPWYNTTFTGVTTGAGTYSVYASLDEGTTWFLAEEDVTGEVSVVAPRVKVEAVGDDSNELAVHAIQRELAPTDGTRRLESLGSFQAENDTTSSMEVFNPDRVFAMLTATDVTNWADAAVILETSFDGENWVETGSKVAVDETKLYQTVELEPTIVGNYVRVKAVVDSATYVAPDAAVNVTVLTIEDI